MVTRRPLRLFVGAVALLLWCGWPAVASADDCATRAARIAARQVPASEVDPDCKKAGIVAAAATVTVAGAAAGIAAVSLGIGLASAGTGSAGGLWGSLGFPGPGPVGGGAVAGPVPTGPGGGSTGVGPASPGGSTTVGAGVPPPALPPTLRGPLAFAALERAGLAERVAGQEGVFRLRPSVQALGQPGAPSTGVSGAAYFLRVDGTLDPNIAVGMLEGGPSSLGSAQAAGAPSASESTSQAPVSRSPEPVSEAGPAGRGEASTTGTSDTSATQRAETPAAGPGAEASAATPATEGLAGPGPEIAADLVEEKIRHAVLELFSPGKLVGGRFHDIEHFREKYQEAKAIENPWEAQQSQDYVVYLFVKEIGVSEPAARTLLELPKAKWEPLATLIASVAH